MQDQWLYLSAAGCLVSALLWPYLLTQFRGAGAPESSDAPHGEGPAAFTPVVPPTPVSSKPLPAVQPRPVEKVSALPVKTLSSEKSPSPDKPAPEAARPPQTSGEASAGAVFLRDMKTQLDSLQKEVKNIKEQALSSGEKRASEFDALVNQIGDIQRNGKEIQDLKKQVLISVQRHESQFESLLNQWNEFRTELHELRGALSSAGSAEAASAAAMPEVAVEPQALQGGPSEEVAELQAPPEDILAELELPQAAGVPETEAPSGDMRSAPRAGSTAFPEAPPPKLDFGRDTVTIRPEPQPAEDSPAEEPKSPKPKRRGPVIIDPAAPGEETPSDEEEPPDSKRRGPVWPV